MPTDFIVLTLQKSIRHRLTANAYNALSSKAKNDYCKSSKFLNVVNLNRYHLMRQALQIDVSIVTNTSSFEVCNCASDVHCANHSRCALNLALKDFFRIRLQLLACLLAKLSDTSACSGHKPKGSDALAPLSDEKPKSSAGSFPECHHKFIMVVTKRNI